MTTIVINDTNAQAKGLIEYIRTLPFVEVIDEPAQKKSFAEEAEGCISVEQWCNELRDTAINLVRQKNA
jgi:hypothetical protein